MADDRIKVGFVGCGGISRLYTDIYAGLADIAQVVAVADLVDELAESRRRIMTEAYRAEAHRARVLAGEAQRREKTAPGMPSAAEPHLRRAEAAESAAQTTIRKYRSHEEILEDDEVQVMVLLTTPAVRAGPIVAAAESGRHVFTQGPMARSVQEADAMVAAVRKAGVKFLSQCGSRYPRDMVLARRAVESGRLGAIGSARVELNWYRPQRYYSGYSGTWDGEGGGAAFHHGRYIIDPFLWVVGARVVEVFAYSEPMLREIETESLTHAVVRYDNGGTGAIHTSLLSHRQERTPQGRFEVLGHDVSMLVSSVYNNFATQGLSRNNWWASETTFGSQDNPAAIEALEALRREVTGHPEQATEEYQSRQFLQNIIDDEDVLVPIDIPRHQVEVVRAMYKSAVERQPVTLPLDEGDPFYGFEGRLAHGKKRLA